MSMRRNLLAMLTHNRGYLVDSLSLNGGVVWLYVCLHIQL